MPMPVTTTRFIEFVLLASPPVICGTQRGWRQRDGYSLRPEPKHNVIRVVVRGPSGGHRLIGVEQPDLEIRHAIHDLAIGLHDAVGHGQLQLAEDYALQINDVLDHARGGCDHAGQLHLADADGAAATRSAEPAEEEARHLPERIEAQAARQYGIALEMAAPHPVERGIACNLELGHDLALAVLASRIRDVGDAFEHQHRRQGQLGIARAEQLTASAGQKILIFKAIRALGHQSACPSLSGLAGPLLSLSPPLLLEAAATQSSGCKPLYNRA